jgi:hypothetical protein
VFEISLTEARIHLRNLLTRAIFDEGQSEIAFVVGG